ncbi:MAG TPA: VOC family protein [Deltaproteobacteria bacterium]|nr:VOC family protein [Deltaproteobacteria bacterium]
MEDRFRRQGMFSWQELLTDDVETSKHFYAKLLGWSFQEFPTEGGGAYWVVKVGKNQVGGIMKAPPEAAGVPSSWGIYITVDDVDASERKALDLGAKTVVRPTNIPGVGRFAVLADPRGAVFSIITYIADR